MLNMRDVPVLVETVCAAVDIMELLSGDQKGCNMLASIGATKNTISILTQVRGVPVPDSLRNPSLPPKEHPPHMAAPTESTVSEDSRPQPESLQALSMAWGRGNRQCLASAAPHPGASGGRDAAGEFQEWGEPPVIQWVHDSRSLADAMLAMPHLGLTQCIIRMVSGLCTDLDEAAGVFDTRALKSIACALCHACVR